MFLAEKEFFAIVNYENDKIVCSAHRDSCDSSTCDECRERWEQLPWLEIMGSATKPLYPTKGDVKDED